MKQRSFFSKLFFPNVAGLDIADQSVRYVVLEPTSGGFELASFGTMPLPVGTIVDGNITDPKKLATVLSELRTSKNIKHVRASLPQSHDFIVENAGMRSHGNDLRAEALARVLVPEQHSHASMIVNVGETQTDISIIHKGKVYLAKSLPLPERPTHMLMSTFHISHSDARDMKRSVGLSRKPEHEAVFVALAKDIMALSRELEKTFVQWHEDKNEKRPHVHEVILSGANAHINGLAEYLSSALRIKVSLGNPWMNINSLETYVPPMHAEEALAYATAFGLALGE